MVTLQVPLSMEISRQEITSPVYRRIYGANILHGNMHYVVTHLHQCSTAYLLGVSLLSLLD